MIQTIILRATLTIQGSDVPDFELMQRIKWDDAIEAMEDVLDREVRQACRQLHQPKPVWKTP